MIEKMVLIIIKLLNHLGKELERAYYETFGDRELMREFNLEAEKRCKHNKNTFVSQAASYIGKKIYKEQNIIISSEIALQMGEMMFYSAKNEGKIDILNNAIEE